MTVPDLAVQAINQYCEERTPPHMRDQVRLEAAVRGNSVTISDCWLPRDGEWLCSRIAQLCYDPTSTRWALHWRDSSERWHRYEDLAPTKNLQRVLAEIERDPTCIFFG